LRRRKFSLLLPHPTKFDLDHVVCGGAGVDALCHEVLTVPGHYHILATRRMSDAMMASWPCVLNDGQIHDQ
jgi:hypothetical protein